MQKALTPQPTLQNGCFAGDKVEYAEEIDIPLSSMSIGGRPLCNLRFADHINLQRCSEEELQQLTERLGKTAGGCGVQISSNNSKIPVNIINIWMNEKRWKKWASSNT